MPALSNPKHEIFARELANGTPADEAYALAGYRKSRSNASVLRTNQNILDRVLELQAAGGERAEITIEGLIHEADQIQRLAMASGQLSAANSALVSKAKLSGHWVEKTENQNINRNNYVVSGEPIDDVEQWEAEYAPKH
jgi:hypothetical protein